MKESGRSSSTCGDSGTNSVHTAILLADSLLDHGPIGRVRTSHGETTYQADADAIFRRWPMAVLVDGNTSGARGMAGGRASGQQTGDRGRNADLEHPSQPGTCDCHIAHFGSGHSDWSVSLTTGILERGNGKPLSSFDRSIPTVMRSRKSKTLGVHPDHLIPQNAADSLGVPGRRMPRERVGDRLTPAERRLWRSFGGCSRSSEPQFHGSESLIMKPVVNDMLMAAAVTGRWPIAPPADIRRAGASGAAACRRGCADTGRTVLVGQPAQRQRFDHRHRGGPGGGRARRRPRPGRPGDAQGDRHLLAVDEAANELLLLEYRDHAVRVVDRLKVAPARFDWLCWPTVPRAPWLRSGRDG